MKRSFKVLLLSLFTMGIVSGTAMAADPAGNKQEKFVVRTAEKLQLNDEQKALLVQLQQSRTQNLQKNADHRAELRKLATAATLDERAVAELAGKMAKELETEIVSSTKHSHEFYHSLNEEQRTTWEQMENRRKELGNKKHPNK